MAHYIYLKEFGIEFRYFCVYAQYEYNIRLVYKTVSIQDAKNFITEYNNDVPITIN